MARSHLRKGHIRVSSQGNSTCKGPEMGTRLECSFKEQQEGSSGCLELEGEGESDGDASGEGGRCYILSGLC